MNNILKKILMWFKWLGFVLLLVCGIIGVWIGSAWGLGYLIDHSFDMVNYGSRSYVAFGSFLLVFVVLINLITLISVGWALIAYGRARGLVKFPQSVKK
jgi:hypothetical protein